jgi:hypothetical protein
MVSVADGTRAGGYVMVMEIVGDAHCWSYSASALSREDASADTIEQREISGLRDRGEVDGYRVAVLLIHGLTRVIRPSGTRL